MRDRVQWMLCVGFLVVGCTVGAVSRGAVEAVASAQPAVGFEYHCEETRARWSTEEVSNVFNRLGAEGWELASMTVDVDRDYQACFKRARR